MDGMRVGYSLPDEAWDGSRGGSEVGASGHWLLASGCDECQLPGAGCQVVYALPGAWQLAPGN